MTLDLMLISAYSVILLLRNINGVRFLFLNTANFCMMCKSKERKNLAHRASAQNDLQNSKIDRRPLKVPKDN